MLTESIVKGLINAHLKKKSRYKSLSFEPDGMKTVNAS